MTTSMTFLGGNASRLIDLLNKMYGNIPDITFEKPFEYCATEDDITGLVKIPGCTPKRLEYCGRNVSVYNEKTFKDELNLDIACLYFKSLVIGKQLATTYDFQFEQFNLSWLEVFYPGGSFTINPKDKDLSMRVYDFATGKLRVGMLNKMVVDKMETSNHTLGLSLVKGSDVKLPEDLEIQMPFVA